MPKLNLGFGSQYRNLVLVAHYLKHLEIVFHSELNQDSSGSGDDNDDLHGNRNAIIQHLHKVESEVKVSSFVFITAKVLNICSKKNT
jgi:hypothetical protein